MNLSTDTRNKNRMSVKELYNSDGLAVCSWYGNKNDYLDFTLPDEPGLDMRDLAFAPIFIKGGWDQIDPLTDETWEINSKFPFGMKDGKEYTVRRGGFVRAYAQEDDTTRICIYPVSPLGQRDFAPIGRVFTKPEGGNIVLPKGGLFVMVEGVVMVKKQLFTGLQIIRAKTADITLKCDPGTRGIGAWRI